MENSFNKLKSMALLALTAIADSLNAQPAIEPDVHDPVAIREGQYEYVFSTGQGVSVMRSSDMKHWTRLRPVFDEAPAWAVSLIKGYKGHTWAPDIIKRNETYYLYYSVSTFGKNTSAIGVATARTLDPDSPKAGWTDHGMVIRSDSTNLWNAIDPNVILDEQGHPWMVWGSWWDGIQLTRLTDDMLSTSKSQPKRYTLASRSRDDRGQYVGNKGAIEAPFLFHRNGYYYLFVSFDHCCQGVKSNYKVAVGRSKTITGPYKDSQGRDMLLGGGDIVLKGNERYPGVGHCSVYELDNKDYIFFHGYDRENEGDSKLLIREVKWNKEGWPIIHL